MEEDETKNRGNGQVSTASDELSEPVMSVVPLRRELSFEDQSSRLPFRRLLVIYLGIGLALVVAFIDQTSVSTAAPAIANDLGGSSTMAWIGTSFFVANCAFQLVYGRLSDIFGRKTTLQVAVLLLALGNLLCSFAKTPIQLYIFRAISGIGGAGITNISMVIVSDIVPLKERGKYQGFITAATSLGNAIGPFVGGGLASAKQWRWLFRTTSILGVIIMALNHFIIPLRPVTGSMRKKASQIDYLGVLLSAASTVLLLVPISGGGSTFAWDSAIVIALLIVGAGCGVAFILNEAYLAKLPILPLRLFRHQTPLAVMSQSFFIGIILFGNIYYVPVYLQYVLGFSPLVSGAIVLAYTLPQAMWGVAAGFYVSKTNHYKRVVLIGGFLWTLGLGLQIYWDYQSRLGVIIGFLEIMSVGVGFCIQTTLVAALATTDSKDRAVVTAGRNFFRTLGAAFGLAIANSIYQSAVQKRLDNISGLTVEERQSLVDSALTLSDPAMAEAVRRAYAGALRNVFIFFAVTSCLSLALSLLIKEVTFRADPASLAVPTQTDDPEAVVQSRSDSSRPLSPTWNEK